MKLRSARSRGSADQTDTREAPPSVSAAASLGLGLALTELDGLTDALGLTDNDTDAEGETLAEGLTDRLTLELGETDADGLTEAETELDGLTLAEALVEGPSIARASTEDTTNDRSTRGRDSVTGINCAPPRTSPPPSLGDAELLGLTDRLTLLDGDTEADGLADNETDGLGLLIASRTANVTIARSSAVPLDPPTGRLPCPAADSQNTQAH